MHQNAGCRMEKNQKVSEEFYPQTSVEIGATVPLHSHAQGALSALTSRSQSTSVPRQLHFNCATTVRIDITALPLVRCSART